MHRAQGADLVGMAQAGVLTRPEAAEAHPGPLAVTTAAPGRHRGLLLGILAVASLVTAIGLRGHAMWFDELQAWNIARASHSLPDLYANLRYEGHPILWYLPLYVITRFTHDPHAMQVLQWVIASATMALVLFRAPFSIPIRVAVLAGYCFAFEYGVVSRSYGLSTLLIVGALVLLARPEPRWATGAVVLVLVSFTSLPAAVLAIALAVTIAPGRAPVCTWRVRSRGRGARWCPSRRHSATGIRTSSTASRAASGSRRASPWS
jgi:hypothetical protein